MAAGADRRGPRPGEVPFSEVAAHRATLEEAYLELTAARSSSAPPNRRDRRRDERHRDAASYRSSLPVGHDRFAQLLHAEWTKFRTVRGWVMTALTAALLIVLFAYLGTFRHEDGGICVGANPASGTCQSFAHPVPPLGPDGEAVTDTYYFVHRALAGDGSITVRVSSLSGRVQGGNGNAASVGDLAGTSGPLQPWAKAGLIVTAGMKPGSAYAAVMLTGAHGVRMQSDYTHDTAGPAVSARAPRWLRLTRSGTTLTGYASADGTDVDRGRLRAPRESPPSRAGRPVRHLSPDRAVAAGLRAGRRGGEATGATATFGRPVLRGGWSPGGVGR